MSYSIVGVVGHIDHGKTSLVAALTGVDTDSHPEEKRRGITIDLGFASFSSGDHTFALVDAPGHQKYIGNLLAGVSNVNIGLLVVAADQGIQAQTLEHAGILQALGVGTLIAAISRCDLADQKTVDELSEELELFLAEFGFEEFPIVSISSRSGAGLDELRQLLVNNVRQRDLAATSYFRMPVDRSFSIEGRGAVAAGTPWRGQASVGDTLEVIRTGDRVRIREMEVHGEPVKDSSVAMRTAMNVVGVNSELKRGDELVAPGVYTPVKRLLVHATLFTDSPDLKTPTEVQLHSGTAACSARLIAPKLLSGGDSAMLVVDCSDSVIATFGQKCLFRRPYPIGSFAGGKVVGYIADEAVGTKRLLEFAEQLVDLDPGQRLAAWTQLRGEMKLDELDLELRIGISPDLQQSAVESALAMETIQSPIPKMLVSESLIEKLRGYFEKMLLRQAESTGEPWLHEGTLVRRARKLATEQLVRWVLERMIEDKLVVRVNQMVAVASEQTVLSKKQRANLDKILQLYRGTTTPPNLKEVASELQITIDAVQSLTRFATQQSVLLDIGNGFLIDHDAFRLICCQLNDLFHKNPNQTVSEIRERLGMTRKHAIPLLEYCDRVGVTVRENDQRHAGPALPEHLVERDGEHG